MSKPSRIQRSRAKGWKMPEGAVYVGRPTKWGNPFVASECADDCQAKIHLANGRVFLPDSWWTGAAVVEMYERWLLGLKVRDGETEEFLSVEEFLPASPQAHLQSLRGRDLVCWCSLGKPCHADILLELANKEG